MAYNYSYKDSSYGYCRITKSGFSYYDAQRFFRYYSPYNTYYDYGTKNGNLLRLLDKLKQFDKLNITKLNDLGYLVSDVLNILNKLNKKSVWLYISNCMVDIEATYSYIENNFKSEYFINFDKYNLPIFMDFGATT